MGLLVVGCLLKWHITVSGLAKVAIFTTKLDAENQSSNLAKTVIRSTEPPLLPNPCYAFVVLLSLGLFVCGTCCHSALAWWLFCFFCLALCCWEKANVPPKAVAHFQVKCLSGRGRQIPFYFQIVFVRCPATNIFQGLLSFFLFQCLVQ